MTSPAAAVRLRPIELEDAPPGMTVHADEDARSEGALPAAVCALDVPPAQPIAWTVREAIPAGEICLIAGMSGAWKTTVSVALCGAKAGGYNAFGHPRFATVAGPVLIVSEEDPDNIVVNRLDALIAGHGWARERVLSNVHILALAGARLSELRWQAHLLAQVERLGAEFVVFDPLYELSSQDEDNNSAQRLPIQFCRSLCARSGASVLIVHHAGKAKEGRSKTDQIRGASAWTSASRATYFVEEREEGVSVENLKLSRARKLPPFVLQREVEERPDEPGTWARARLYYRTVHAVEMDRAQRWVLDQLAAYEDRLSTSDLKRQAAGTGISGQEVSEAIKWLSEARRIDYEEGPKNAKRWGLSCLPGNHGKQPDTRLPSLPDACPASTGPDALLAAPFRGQGKAAAAPASGNHDLELEEGV